MTDAIRQYVESLYAPEEVEKTYKGILDLIATYAPRLPERDASELFSEKDVVLITYGDSLKQEGQEPLETLHHFAKANLKGIFSAIHILPFYPYSSDDGFSVIDYYAVNEEMGAWPQVEAMGQDFDLMFDAVFNHMSAQSEWFQKFLADDPEYAGMFVTESPETDLSMVTRPRALPLLHAFEKPDGETVHVWTTFSADQVDLDVRTPETLIRLLDVLLFYVEKGASLIRLDAIAYLWKIAGTSSIHLKQTHEVIYLMRAVLDAIAPHVVLITETNVPHQENVSYFGDGYNEAQMVYNFTLPPLLFHTMLSGDASKLREWVNTLDTPSDRTTFFNFIASHDGIGVRPVEGILSDDELAALIKHVESRGGRVSYKRNSDGTDSPYELNITYVDAVTDPAEPEAMQVQRFIVSQAIGMALAGVPAIYIHSLLGSHNDVAGMERTGHNRTINRAKLQMAELQPELDNAGSFRAQVFAAYTDLLKKRVAQPAFHPNGRQRALDLGNSGVFALMRTSVDETQRILALYNVTGQCQRVDLSAYIRVPGEITGGAAPTLEIELEPYQVRWLEL